MFKKIIKILPFCLVLFSIKTFALTYTLPEHCREWEIYFNLVQNFCIEKALDISDIKVKFTQDDIYYYFDVNTEVSLADNAKNHFNDDIFEWWYGSPYDGRTFRSDDLYPYLYGVNNFTDKPIYRYTETHVSNAGEYWTNYEYITVNGNTIATLNYKNSFNKQRDSYYRTWYNTYFYIPHPLSDYCWFGYGNKWNPNTGEYNLYFPNATEALPSHDGFSLLSRSCSIKERTMSGNIVNTCTYQLYSKLRIEKTKFDRYRYLAFGGPLYIAFDGGNELFIRLKVCCGSSNVYNLGEHINCNHDWYYTYDIGTDTHNKICRNCEWCITKNHEFDYEYDGFENNMCECGYTKKVNVHYYINDDTINEKHFVHNSNTEEEYARYTDKEGFRFLYYEKYEIQPASTSVITYSTVSTALKTVLVDIISTASDINGKVECRSLIYKATSEELRFKVNYHASNGVFENGEKKITKEYTYWEINKLEDLQDTRDDLNYLAYWKYGEKKIKQIGDIRKCIVDQDMTLDLYAVYGRLQYGKSEKIGEGGEPQKGGGLNDKTKYKNEINKKGPDYEEPIEVHNTEEIKEKKRNTFELEKNNVEESEKSVYAMTKTDIMDLCKQLGITPATISDINGGYKFRINGDSVIVKFIYLFLKYKIPIIILVLAFIVIYLVLW